LQQLALAFRAVSVLKAGCSISMASAAPSA
jgi:hypothetical protein